MAENLREIRVGPWEKEGWDHGRNKVRKLGEIRIGI